MGICYVNGSYLPEADASISIFDRGFLFADGVYEVASVLDGALIDNAAHLRRLERSLSEIRITPPCPLDEIEAVQKRLVERNDLREGLVYLQITRGAAKRDFPFPAEALSSLVMFTQAKSILADPMVERGAHVVTVDDLRWKRRDIKTVGLLGSVLAKQTARDRGADDAWMLEDGVVTEASSSNAYIVTQDNVIVTRHLGPEILHGVTRKAVLSLAEEAGLEVHERAFSQAEAYSAREAFMTSASSFVMPVVKIDEAVIGDGAPGALSRRLRALYLDFAKASAT